MANATKYLKKLATATPDAIATALRACPLDRATIGKLKDLSELIAKAPKETSASRRTPENDFLQIVLPKLEEMLAKHQENPTDVLLGSVSFDYQDVMSLDLEQLAGHHGLLMTQEKSLKTRMLFMRYQRGLIYIRAHHLIDSFEELKEWLINECGISYTTSTAYMSVASLIKTYPLLLKADLSFDQLRRHHNRLRSYLKAHPDFGLDESIVVTDGESEALVETNPNQTVVPDKAPRDADFEYVILEDEEEENFPCYEELAARS